MEKQGHTIESLQQIHELSETEAQYQPLTYEQRMARFAGKDTLRHSAGGGRDTNPVTEHPQFSEYGSWFGKRNRAKNEEERSWYYDRWKGQSADVATDTPPASSENDWSGWWKKSRW